MSELRTASTGGAGGLRIIIAGGGTGGHLYPGLAIADEIMAMRPGATIVFVGTRGRIEERVVPASGYQLRTIWISGFRRALSILALLFPLKLAVSLVQSLALLRRLRPQVVVGTGGYVCGPVLFVAAVLGVPTLIHEQNSYPGVTTRLLAPRVDEVHITFDSTRKFLSRAATIHLSGNPTRSSLGGPRRNGGHAGMKLLVFGGSQGSVAVNSAVLKAMPEILATGAEILWQTGERDYTRISGDEVVRKAVEDGIVQIHRYIEAMGEAYASSDLVVCRAGATTLAELMRVGMPSLLIPLPGAAADHQSSNARTMEEAGAAIVLTEEEAGEQLGAVVGALLHDRVRLHTLGENALKLGKPDAARILAVAVIARAEREHG